MQSNLEKKKKVKNKTGLSQASRQQSKSSRSKSKIPASKPGMNAPEESNEEDFGTQEKE